MTPDTFTEEPLVSADLLRRAASKLREHANAAADGPWHPASVLSPDSHATSAVYSWGYPTGTSESEVVPSRRVEPRWPNRRLDAGNAEYIALMHPPVALALADLLERAAFDPNRVDNDLYAELEHTARAVLRVEVSR